MERELEKAVTKKCVTFQPTTTIVRFHDFTTADERWHSIPDRKRFVVQARDEARRWTDKGCYEFLLKDALNDASEESAQAKMDAYAQLPDEDYCRGLERHVCREHGFMRDSFKKGAIRAIVNEGRKRRGMPQNQCWYQLGEISRTLSSGATRFARRVGAADELVARLGEDASKVRRLRTENDCMRKQIMAMKNPAAGETQREDSAKNICIDTYGDYGKSIHVQGNTSPVSVTTVISWCHGPRESCIGAANVGSNGC
jgi:hypothetical protein